MRSRDRASSDRTNLERPRSAEGRSTTTSTRSTAAATGGVHAASHGGASAARPTEGVRRRVDVDVMGLSLTLRTDREDAWVHGIAGQVNRRLDELKRTARNANPQQLAVLVALNLAEELQTERQRAAGREHELERQLEALATGALTRVKEALAALGDDEGADDDDDDDDDDGDDHDGA